MRGGRRLVWGGEWEGEMRETISVRRRERSVMQRPASLVRRGARAVCWEGLIQGLFDSAPPRRIEDK